MLASWTRNVWRILLGWNLISLLLLPIVSAAGNSHLVNGYENAFQVPLGAPELDQAPLEPLSQNPPGPGHRYGSHILLELLTALEYLQGRFFEVWMGGWPNSIDWTGAVLGTYVSTALNTLTRAVDVSSDKTPGPELETEQALENVVSKYFTQVTAYYFGQDAFGLRQQAHDDMLWVVLGWLDSIKFMNLHNGLHHLPSTLPGSVTADHSDLGREAWFGKQFEAAHAHRARVFYDIVHKAWDRSLCGGGLNWNPKLQPYKNAITNEQYVSASIGMYLYHPGDNNTSPFLQVKGPALHTSDGFGLSPLKPHAPEYLQAAIEAYDWLVAVNMINDDGLYVDGYHISSEGKQKEGVKQCDQRNEMVYTYNHGVILSGLRDLWEGTGNKTYLEDGHELVQNVIKATGWTRHDLAHANSADLDPNTQWQEYIAKREEARSGEPQSGTLGSDGILTEQCDVSGTCTQDAQTFKGIFFTHLAAFCARLPTTTPLIEHVTFVASKPDAKWHKSLCAGYGPWVAWNGEHALRTKNEQGLFGMWWGASRGSPGAQVDTPSLPEGAIDVRNEGVPRDRRWLPGIVMKAMPIHDPKERSKTLFEQGCCSEQTDANDRGRGRTVETQGGGLALMRAWWELWDLTRQE